jgi:hypothetical protein
MVEVALRETIDADLGTLFEFQADPEASAMAAFQSRDRAAFIEHEAKIKADPSAMTRTIVAGGGVVGWIGSWEVEGERDVGFWIGRDHWETPTRPRPCARSSTSTSTGRCTPTWPTTTSVLGACSRSAASYSTTWRRKETCWSTCSC